MDRSTIEEALRATGELVAASGQRFSIVVVGGASLTVLGIVVRATNDVDVIAVAEKTQAGEIIFQNANPLPEIIIRAAGTVARDRGLPPNWLNSVVGSQFEAGLPPDLEKGLEWRSYGGLEVGFAGRQALIFLKLYAAADNSPSSVHTQDLIALRPTAAELAVATKWVVGQDASPEFASIVTKVVEHVIQHMQ